MRWCGDVMQSYRKAMKITQKEMGKILGVTQQSVCKYEDWLTPPLDKITLIARTLHISEAELLDIDLDVDSYKTGFRAGAAFIIDKICKDVDKALVGRW